MTATPGYFVKHWLDPDNPAGPLLRVTSTAGSDTADIEVRRSYDGGTTWESAVVAVAGVPAQKPEVRGRSGDVILSYHDSAGEIQTLYSLDDGATWS